MYSTKIKNNKKSPRSRKKLLTIGVIIVVILVAAFLIYWKFIRQSDKITLNTAPTASSQTKGETSSPSTGSGTSTQTPANGGSSTTTTTGDKGSTTGSSPQTTATLTAPLGNFVSNHHPNLSGKPAPNQMQSVCNTTPGATCQISFTNGSIVRSLPTQTTDSGGAAYWTWKLQDIGLTAGTWTVKATANLGSQTQTATDAASLVVQP